MNLNTREWSRTGVDFAGQTSPAFPIRIGALRMTMQLFGVLMVALAIIVLGLSAQVTAQPKPKDVTVKDVKDCDGAQFWLEANKHPGESVTGYDENEHELHTRDKPSYRQWTDVTWKYSLEKSSIILRVFRWENMSPGEIAAVARYRRATLAHEIGHHREAQIFLKREKHRIIGTGSNFDEAADDFRDKEKEYYSDFKERFDKVAKTYDHKTNGGNIKLVCPKSAGRMVLPAEREGTFPGTSSVEKGVANIRTALSVLGSTEVGRGMMATGGEDIVQGVCAAKAALRAIDPLSDRYVEAEHIQGGANDVVWPFRSPKDLDALVRATASYREKMGAVTFPSDGLDDEERGYFLSAAIVSLWHEVARAKLFLDQSPPEQDRAMKAWIADQVKNPNSIYSCASEANQVELQTE
jgi:hypothetical protein